ncbi:hypothetical protein SLE2022_222700 [Rubroshorea leprosula]
MASNPVSNSQDGVARSISDAPPTHYVVKIQLFSLLLKNSVEKYESGDFEAGATNGNWFSTQVEIKNQDNYLVVHDATAKERRFRGLRNQWRFDQFLPLRTFNDVASGYLVDDTCVFGAEVYVTKEMSVGN